jgi:hypothetical protein
MTEIKWVFFKFVHAELIQEGRLKLIKVVSSFIKGSVGFSEGGSDRRVLHQILRVSNPGGPGIHEMLLDLEREGGSIKGLRNDIGVKVMLTRPSFGELIRVRITGDVHLTRDALLDVFRFFVGFGVVEMAGDPFYMNHPRRQGL